MKLPGIVTNVTAFGAFVDIGVHQDGLVHISQMSDDFVKNPADVLKVGQRVQATVMEVDMARKRIALSLKTKVDLAPRTDREERSRQTATSANSRTATAPAATRPRPSRPERPELVRHGAAEEEFKAEISSLSRLNSFTKCSVNGATENERDYPAQGINDCSAGNPSVGERSGHSDRGRFSFANRDEVLVSKICDQFCE